MFLKLTHISFNSKSLGKHVYPSADNTSFYSLKFADNTAFTTAISTSWSQSQYDKWPSKMLYTSVHEVPGPRLGWNKGYYEWGFLWSSSALQSSIISQLYHNYFLQNASAISQLQHKYFLPNASAISQLQHKYFPPNASAISQIHHDNFLWNASAMSPTQQHRDIQLLLRICAIIMSLFWRTFNLLAFLYIESSALSFALSISVFMCKLIQLF